MRQRRVPRFDDPYVALGVAAAQRVRRVGAFGSNRDDREVLAFGDRVVDRVGPADDRDHVVLVEERQRRGEPVRGAVGVEQADRVARGARRVGRGEDARAHPPQRAVRRMMREDAPARHDEAGRFGREPRERVRGFGRERVVRRPCGG